MDIKDWFKNLIATNYFFTKVENTKEISDPIVSAIEKKVIPVVDPNQISSPIVDALEDVVSAIEDKEGVEEVTVKNISEAKADFTEVITILTEILNKEEKEIEFPEQKDVVIDLKPIVKGLEELKKKIPVIKPLELIDYTDSLKRIVSAIEVDRTGLLAKTKDMEALATLLQEIRDKEEKEIPFDFNKDGRLKVEVDRVGGGGSFGSATEDTLSDIASYTEDRTVTGSLGSLNSTVELPCRGAGSALVQVSGTWTGKIEFQGAIDGVWNTLSIFQPTGAITRNGIQNDNQNGLYRVVIVSGYSTIRAKMTSYSAGSATILFNASSPVGSSQIWQLNPANLNVTSLISDGTDIANVAVGAVTGEKGLRVFTGPTDPLSDIPVYIDLEHHQIHEGETHKYLDQQLSLGTSTVKYAISVGTYPVLIRCPHLLTECDVYNGNVRVDIFEGATFTGGTLITDNNRNRNFVDGSGSTYRKGVTSTDGNLIDSYFASGGIRTAGSGRVGREWVLKSNTVYRIDVIGLTADTQAIVSFNSYEDLGV